jgi:hypothetical protein
MNSSLVAALKKNLTLILQGIGGVLVVVVIYWVATAANPYVSAWSKENSSFFEAAGQGLKMFGVHPTAPTVFVFWDMQDEEGSLSLRSFNKSPSNLRIYGIHQTTEDTMAVRKHWLKYAPRRASLILDRSEMLKTSFRVRGYPTVFLLLPKQKLIYSYVGDINDNRERMNELIQSE